MTKRLKIKNGSHRSNTKTTRPRHEYKYTQYKMFLSMMMIMCNRHHLTNKEKLSKAEAELKKSADFLKKHVNLKLY